MIRRRRPAREIEFSFDSFLDVVANVVGIILRLILVAWVGARSYKAVVPPLPPDPPALAEHASLPEVTDDRLPLLAARRQEIQKIASQISEQERQNAAARSQRSHLADELAELEKRREGLLDEEKKLAGKAEGRDKEARSLTLSVDELQGRSKKLLSEIEAVRKLPVKKKSLRYRTPVSKPLQSEQVMFECRQGRVTLLDTAALLDQVKKDLRQKAEGLRERWEVNDTTSPVGAFRLRYVIERERSLTDGPGGKPAEGNFRYGLSSWEAEPVRTDRGEAAEAALKKGSDFLRVIEGIDPDQTAVTFWVYPDSFDLYRQLRDYLHEKDMVVAGRPLPEGVRIASGRKGTVSRGQ